MAWFKFTSPGQFFYSHKKIRSSLVTFSEKTQTAKRKDCKRFRKRETKAKAP